MSFESNGGVFVISAVVKRIGKVGFVQSKCICSGWITKPKALEWKIADMWGTRGMPYVCASDVIGNPIENACILCLCGTTEQRVWCWIEGHEDNHELK